MAPIKFCLNGIFFAFLLAGFPGYAQVSQPVLNKYYVEHFGEEEGLPQNSVNNILPDENDFLWIATEGGITRFNGNRFLTVPVAANISGSSITRTKNFYFKSKDTLLAFAAANYQMAVIVNNKIISIERHSNIKFGIPFFNLHRTMPCPEYLKKTSVENDEIVKNWDISNGNVIGKTYNKDTFMVLLEDGIGIYNATGKVSQIKVDKNIALQVLFLDQQVLYLDKKNFINFYSISGFKKKELLNIPSKHQLRILPNSYGTNFFCIADSVLYMVDIATGKIHLQKILTNLQHAEDVSVIYLKDSNTIVTGTIRNGLYIYKKQYFQTTEPLPDKESDAFYGQQLLADNKTIFTGFNMFFKNGQFIRKTNGAVTTNQYSSLKDRNGYYWYVFGNRILRTRNIGVPADTILYLKGFISIYFEDNQGRIWLRDGDRFGYFINGKFTVLVFNNLATPSISCMRQDIDGKYLIGTRSGLFMLKDIHELTIKEIPEFKELDIRYLLPQQDGKIWVCTYGHGFYLINKEEIVRFPQANGKLSYVHSIIEDSKGYFWLPTNNGLFVTSRESLNKYITNRNELPFYYQFSKKHGLRTNEFNGGAEPAFLRLPGGDISLPSMQGLVNFNPDIINFNFSSSPILVDNIQADSTEIHLQDEFNVESNINNISFSLSSSFWGEKENDLLEYRVVEKGKSATDDLWLPVDGSGNVNIFSPSYGDYQLIIRKRKGLKYDDYLYKVINFHVLPKWYQTKVFLMAAILSSLILIMGVSVWRRNYYRKVNRILKEKVDAATSELQLMNNTLEEKVEQRTMAIQEAERKFRDLVEKSLVGVYIFKNGRFVYVNPRFAEIFGYSEQELTAMVSVDSLVYEPDREIIVNNSRIAIENSSTKELHYEMRGLKKDGTLIHTEVFGRKTQFEGSAAIIGTLIDITEKKQAEEQLITEKNLSQSIINSLPGVLFIFDQDRRHLLWNKNFEKVTGYTAEELKEKPAGKCVEPEDVIRFTQAVEKIYHNGTAEVEVTLINKSKDKIPFYVNGIAITYNGRPCVLGVGIDISERKKAEMEREKANYDLNERIKELTTLYRAGVILQKEDRSIVITLQELVSTLPPGWQYPDNTVARITLTKMEFMTPGFRTSAFRQAANFETPRGTTGMIEVFYLEEREQKFEGPFLEEERNLINMLADMVRIYLTRREDIHALQKSEANLNTIFVNTDTVYLLLDMDLKIIAFNQRALDSFEREQHKTLFLYNSFVYYMPEHRQEEFIENAKKVMQGHHISYEVNYPQPDGTFHWYYVRLLPILNSNKATFGMMVVISDITEKKHLEQQILDRKIQEQKMIIRAILIGEEKERNKVGQELHDNVNQILAGTKLYLSMARNNKHEGENIINESIKLLDSAIEEIRGLSKGKVTPMKKVNLEELLQTLIDRFSETASIDTDFIYNGSDQTIEDDIKLNIYRIIQEQLNNIYKHAHANHIAIIIEVKKDNIHVSVADDGKGFDVEKRKKGIGIANMINRVESFNGTIEIESSPGNGCRTEINLPV